MNRQTSACEICGDTSTQVVHEHVLCGDCERIGREDTATTLTTLEAKYSALPHRDRVAYIQLTAARDILLGLSLSRDLEDWPEMRHECQEITNTLTDIITSIIPNEEAV